MELNKEEYSAKALQNTAPHVIIGITHLIHFDLLRFADIVFFTD